jgi:muconate cycloisomerase
MRAFEHAAAKRDLAEAVVVRAAFSDGGAGWGETLPRPYVTGETIESVVADLEAVVWPAVAGLDWADPRAALTAIPAVAADGRCMNAAACATELACVDWLLAKGGDEPRTLAALVGGAGVGGSDRAAGRIAARVTGVLGSADPARTAHRLRLMHWYGLRDFKLKLGFGEDVDRENLRLVHARLRKGIAAGRCSLRVDVNGGWDAATTPARAEELKAMGVCVIEQPVYCTAEELAALAQRCPLPLMADESLLTAKDAAALLAEPQKIWWNIRICKNGGLAGSLHLARLAEEHHVPYSLGCMVGESSILSAAQRRLLQLNIHPRFIEGNYGRFLLKDDLTFKSLRFGYGGRLRALPGPGLGVTVNGEKLARYGQLVKSLQG